MTNLSPSHLILVNAEQKLLLALWQSILDSLANETDFHFTEEEKAYWMNRCDELKKIIAADADMMKIGIELLKRKEAISALVPFVNKVNLN